jgi:pimeloyl-ACP methyl ester carboxylesterase
MLLVRHWLRDQPDSVFLMTYEDGSEPDISTFSLRVAQQLRNWSRTHDHIRSWTLVGHSMGGLIAAQAATLVEDMEPPIRVDRVVTWNTPWEGSPLLEDKIRLLKSVLGQYYEVSPRHRDMRRGSIFLQRLRDRILASRVARDYHFVGVEGEWIVPAHASLPDWSSDFDFRHVPTRVTHLQPESLWARLFLGHHSTVLYRPIVSTIFPGSGVPSIWIIPPSFRIP